MILLFVLFILSLQSLAATFEPSLGLTQSQYALEKTVSSVFQLNMKFSSDHKTEDLNKAIWDIDFYGEYEPGPLGDRTLDLDPVVYRFNPKSFKASHLWAGRTHPFLEGGFDKKIQAKTALGSNWQQNTSAPWNPKVGGWIGAGGSFEVLNKIRVTVAGAPVFLPNFGPKLKLSETDFSSGSRFSRLPPQYINLNGVYYPLRYRVETGEISKILLQPQGFLSIGTSDARVFAWTSPAGDPDLSTEGVLKVSQTQDPVVRVTARPSFPRKNFVGYHLQNTYSVSNIEYFRISHETVIETNEMQPTLSVNIEMTRFTDIGFINRWEKKSTSSTNSIPKTADFYHKLLTLSLGPNEDIEWKFKPKLNYERHFSKGQSDQVINPIVSYVHPVGATIFLQARVIIAEDNAYWGYWREYDSVSLGGRLKW